MSRQDLFSVRKKTTKKKVLECRLLQILLGALKVNINNVKCEKNYAICR